MRSTVISLLFIATLAIGGFVTSAQRSNQGRGQQQQRPNTSPTPPPDDQGDVIPIATRRVRLPITVLNKKNELVTGLAAGDFQIYEDKQLQTIESFAADESARQPFYVGVLMDTSASTAGKLKFEREAAMNFIYTVARPRKDRVAFVTFDDEVNLRQDFTDRMDLLQRAVEGTKKPGNRTSLFDAVYNFCDEKMRSAPGQRVIVLITDGDDAGSHALLTDAIDIAQRTETVIFAISTKGAFSGTIGGTEMGQVADRGDKELERLCEETGGRAFFTGDILALERSFTRIAKELRAQYVVTYRSTNDVYNGQFRRIEVRLTNKRDGMKVRAKSGYTALAERTTR